MPSKSAHKIKVMIADDHAIVREGIAALLGQDERILVCGEAGNGQELLNRLHTQAADVVILDHEMPVMNGLATIQLLRASFPALKVIVLSVYQHTKLKQAYAKFGAFAFINKGFSSTELIQIIIAAGKNTGRQKISTASQIPLPPKKRKQFFTRTELEIIQLICQGYSNAEIAKTLGISGKTVSFHKKNIYEKTGQKNSAGIILFVNENKITH